MTLVFGEIVLHPMHGGDVREGGAGSELGALGHKGEGGLAVEDEELLPHAGGALQDKLVSRGAAGVTCDVRKAGREGGGGWRKEDQGKHIYNMDQN